MPYDARCKELAEVFLADFPSLNTPEKIDELAQSVQEAIDDWFAGEPE